VITSLRVLGRAAYLSVYEFFGLYSPVAWLIAWVPRVIFESLFFALLAQFVGGPDLLLFALVGIAAYRTLHTTLTFTTASVTWELFAGTVPLLVASPTNPIVVLTGRNLAWALNGLITGVITIGVAATLGLVLTPLTAVGAVAVLAVIEVGAYALGVLLGSVVLRFPGLRNMTSSLVGFALLAISGVNIPLTALPEWVQSVALAAPLAHGLLALREVLGPGDATVYMPLVATELLIAVAYLGLAVFSFQLFLQRARSMGTLDYH
jgi:ABC-2 type transport system permease protein